MVTTVTLSLSPLSSLSLSPLSPLSLSLSLSLSSQTGVAFAGEFAMLDGDKILALIALQVSEDLKEGELYANIRQIYLSR